MAASNSSDPVPSLNDWVVWEDPSTGQLLRRSLLMRAAQEGSLPVLKLLLETGADVNLQSPDDGLTALHAGAVCASGESALSAIQLLLQFGANRELKDHQGRRPLDVFMTSGLFNSSGVKEGRNTPPEDSLANQVEQDRGSIRPEAASAAINSQAGPSPEDRDDDPSTAEFRMYRFKVDPCPHLQTLHDHDWTECPYAHPGEKARRRDLRKYNYTSTACPDFRKGTCKRGDGCQYAHGVFECWMHPSKYRTQLCKDAGACARTVCFFAHSLSELRAPPEGAEDVGPLSELQPNLGADQSSFPTSASSIAQEQHVSTCGSIASAEAQSREVNLGMEEWAQRGSFTQLMASSVSDPPRSTGSIRQLVGMAAAEQLVPQRSACSFPQMTAGGAAALDTADGLGQLPLSQHLGAGSFPHQQQQPAAGSRSETPDSAASSVSLASLLDRLKVQSCASPSRPPAVGPAAGPAMPVKQQPVVRNAAAGSLLASLGGGGGSVTSLSTTPYFTPAGFARLRTRHATWTPSASVARHDTHVLSCHVAPVACP